VGRAPGRRDPADSGIEGDLLFDGQWDLSWNDRLRLRAELACASGDLTLVARDSDTGLAARVRASLRQARLQLTSDGPAVTARLDGTAPRPARRRASCAPCGHARRPGRHALELARRRAAQRPAKARLPRSCLVGAGPARLALRGALAADVRVAGTRGQPQVAGTLSADDLALRSVVDGFALGRGACARGWTARKPGDRRAAAARPRHRRQGTTPAARCATGQRETAASRPAGRDADAPARQRAGRPRHHRLGPGAGCAGGRQVTAGGLRMTAVIEPPTTAPPAWAATWWCTAPGRRPARRPRPRRPAAVGRRRQGAARPARDLRACAAGAWTRAWPARCSSARKARSGRRRSWPAPPAPRAGAFTPTARTWTSRAAPSRFTGALDNPGLDIVALRPNFTADQRGRAGGRQRAAAARAPVSDPSCPTTRRWPGCCWATPRPATGAESAMLQSAALALLGDARGAPGWRASFGLDELELPRQRQR
jgi:translocation and assembly module TamB